MTTPAPVTPLSRSFGQPVNPGPAVQQAMRAQRDRAVKLDELRAQRSYRNWSDWIEARAAREPIAVLLMIGGALDRLAPGLRAAHDLGQSDVVELVDRVSARGGQATQAVESRWAPPGRRLLVVDHPGDLSLESKGWLRREAAILVVDSDAVGGEDFERLLEASPLGVLELAFGQAQEGPTAATPQSPDGARHRLVLTPDCNLATLLQNLIPRELEPDLRIARTARDVLDMMISVSAEGAGAQAAEAVLSNEALRIARSEQQKLDYEIRVLTAAKAEVGGALKTVIANLRAAKAELEPTQFLTEGRSASFTALLTRIEVGSGELPEDVIESRARREWWRGTVWAALSIIWSRKYELRVRQAALDAALNDDRLSIRHGVATLVGEHLAAFEDALQAVRKSFVLADGVLASAAQESAGRRRGGEGMASTPDSYAAAVDKAFAEFAKSEARSLRIDRERKGLVGLVGEARSAVFAVFFVAAMFLKQVQLPSLVKTLLGVSDGPDLMKKLAQVALVFVVVAFIVNLFNAHRFERALVAERVDSKLEELAIRLIALADRVLKEQVSVLEAHLTDRATSMEVELTRHLSTLRTQKDATKVLIDGYGDSGARPADTTSRAMAQRAAQTEQDDLQKAGMAARDNLIRKFREGA